MQLFVPYLLFKKLHDYAIDARRRDRTWRYLAWSLAAGASAGVIIGATLSFAWLLILVHLWWLGIPFAVVLSVPMLEPILMRHVIVPMGWVRTAYRVAARSDPGKDSEAYALCAAAWAYAHRPRPADEAWLIAARDKRTPLGDAEVVTTALMASARGDAATARALLRSVRDLVEVHPHVRELAGEWLACDAAERGAWADVHADADAAAWPASPLTYLLEGIAARRVGAPGAPGRRELYARWLLAPQRAVTWGLLADVDAARAPGDPAPAATAADADGAPGDDLGPDRPAMPRAIAAHLAFVAARGGSAAPAFAHAVRSWDEALADGELRAWIARRAFELDAPLGSAERVMRDVAESVVDELGRAADAAQLGAPAGIGAVGGPLARQLRHGRLDSLEAGFRRWDDRRKYGDVRTATDEWREFVALRAAYETVSTAGGMELRRLAFPHAYTTGTSVAVWLWNTRSEYVLARAILAWLLDEAMAVGDTQAIETCTRNTRLPVPTRLGKFIPPAPRAN
jgi:hypothetical protein|nr:hypothetical protein [Kofleriaceae bacterium]